jgi:hypothetical protein
VTEDTFVFVVAVLAGTLARYGARLARTTDMVALVTFFVGLGVAGVLAWAVRVPLGPTGRMIVAAS